MSEEKSIIESTWSFVDNLTQAASKIWTLDTQRRIANANIEQSRLNNHRTSSITPNAPAPTTQLALGNTAARVPVNNQLDNRTMLIIAGGSVTLIAIILIAK